MKDLFIGIDLGTTNSVISYGNVLPNNTLKCNIIETDRKSENGSKVRNKTLPSVVFYSKDATGNIVATVGDYAKSRYGTRYGYVSKSVKSLIGIEDNAGLNDDIPDKTPADVSAQILRHMLTFAKGNLFQSEAIRDVIITIPASFDSDQCQATLDAAKIAGVDIDNEHDVLLYEPKAVIYDFVHMQELGEIPTDLIDFSYPKNILVFDLGGGTLDVTLHKVGYNENGMMSIEDIAIARYTQIGGDNFDALLAKAMFERFEEQNGINVPSHRKDEVMCTLTKKAEQAKIELNNANDNAIAMETELPPDYEIAVCEINLYDSYSYDDYFSKQEIEDIISPLLANNLTYEDIKIIDSLPEDDINNIIYPIMDVLAKAGQNNKVDAVIMNGGMTKFYPIKQRVDSFLHLNSICHNDPDLAVARGAVYYHYCLHKYNIKKAVIDENNLEPVPEATQQFETATILNDTLSIGIKGEYIINLLDAGTKLPYVSDEIRDVYCFSDYTKDLAIDIYLGRGKTKNLPNRRIATRLLHFTKAFKATTKISIKFAVDSLRIVTIKAWITDSPTEFATTTIMNSKNEIINKMNNIPRIDTIKAIKLNPKSEINILRNLEKTINWKSKSIDKQKEYKINAQIARIKNASNAEEFYDVIIQNIEVSDNSTPFKGYLYEISQSFADRWNKSQISKIASLCKRHYADIKAGYFQHNYVMINAFIFVFLFADDGDDFARHILSHKVFKIPAYKAVKKLLNMPLEIQSTSRLISLCSENNINIIPDDCKEEELV